jgi:hypothetical protein
MKPLVWTIVIATALSVPLSGQTLAEQLEKAIFVEETLKNPEEASKLYRQIIAAAAVPKLIAQEAERRLARLTKPSNPASHVGFIAFPSGVSGSPRGVVESGRYRHVATGITFVVPQGWTAGVTHGSSDDGEQLAVTDDKTQRAVNIWMIREDIPRERIAERLAGAPDEKLRQRHSGYMIPGMRDSSTYEIPRETVKRTVINGREAIIAIGNYQGIPPERFMQPRVGPPPSNASEPMHEYMTWVYTERSRAFFFARAPVGELEQLRRSVEQLVNSAVIP